MPRRFISCLPSTFTLPLDVKVYVGATNSCLSSDSLGSLQARAFSHSFTDNHNSSRSFAAVGFIAELSLTLTSRTV